ncbi:MAG: pyruvate kinase [Acidobacteria bacterium]|nr:pyruvate kinase [Acidobacteriota bacterium]
MREIMAKRRTKIICTLGPATNSREAIGELIKAGMDVARLNFSHGAHEQHAKLAGWVREAAKEAGRPVSLLQDLAGPKIRTGRLRGGHPISLTKGQKLLLTADDTTGTARRISVTYPGLAKDVRKGNRILLSDGLIELRVLRIVGDEVETEVMDGGILGERKGVNLPGVRLRVGALTEKDEADLRFGIRLGVDYVAISFVRKAEDIRRVKALLEREKASIPVLAKLEKPEAVKNLDAILAVSDGVMVARGDLGVELPPEQVPLIQKKIIREAGEAKIPVITATQMLESMTVEPRPTRAEASDVANAIFDGTDAVMLSAETATGRYPIEAVQMMARIAEQADAGTQEQTIFRRSRPLDIAETISESVAHAAHMLAVKAVVVFTRSGSTARMISKYRPPCPVYAFCHEEAIARRAALYWGVTPFVMPLTLDAEATLAQAEAELFRRKLIARGEILAVAAGSPGQPGQTNVLRLIRAGIG